VVAGIGRGQRLDGEVLGDELVDRRPKLGHGDRV
jgi:hypothetical protein